MNNLNQLTPTGYAYIPKAPTIFNLEPLSQTDLARKAALYIRRSKGDLVRLCNQLSLDTQGTKEDLAARIAAQSMSLVQVQ